MLFVYESKRRFLAGEPQLRVLSGPEVEYKLKTHRLDEMLSLYKPVSRYCSQGPCKPSDVERKVTLSEFYIYADRHYFEYGHG